MEKYEAGKQIRLSEIVSAVVTGELDADNYCLYTKEDMPSAAEDPLCFLDAFPDVSLDTHEEIYPVFVAENNLHLFYHGDLLVDVIENAKAQKERPTVQDFLAGLDYYLKNDTFRDL